MEWSSLFCSTPFRVLVTADSMPYIAGNFGGCKFSYHSKVLSDAGPVPHAKGEIEQGARPKYTTQETLSSQYLRTEIRNMP